MNVERVVQRLRCFGLIVTEMYAGRWSVRGHGLVGVLSEDGRWPEDPSPCLYLSAVHAWDRMANACYRDVPPVVRSSYRQLRRGLLAVPVAPEAARRRRVRERERRRDRREDRRWAKAQQRADRLERRLGWTGGEDELHDDDGAHWSALVEAIAAEG